jgi:hypothetical protein
MNQAQKIKQLEVEIAALKLQVAALESRPVYVQIVPLTHPPSTVYPMTGVGDFSLERAMNSMNSITSTCSGTITNARGAPLTASW